MLFHRIHQLAIGLVIPPHESEIAVHHIRARMDMADDALTRRNLQREFMLDRMSRFAARDRRIGRMTCAAISEARVWPGMHSRTVIRVDHVTRRTTARTVVARMIVRAEEVQSWIEQASLLQADENRIRSVLSSESAVADPFTRASRFF